MQFCIIIMQTNVTKHKHWKYLYTIYDLYVYSSDNNVNTNIQYTQEKTIMHGNF